MLVVAVTAANVGDRDAAGPLLQRLRMLRRETTLVWADGGYTGGLVRVSVVRGRSGQTASVDAVHEGPERGP
ncbi:transposase [Streptomyces sanglieri]|uniref:transposase n=1 Tax=Streptomyces sanglieri TaxID=193460 RepID=UPI00352353EA